MHSNIDTGVYLTDLTFIEDGIPSLIKKTDLINFAKRAKTAEVIREIQTYQNVSYPFKSVPELQDYILSMMQTAGDVHEMYERSLHVEPREREDEKIARFALPMRIPPLPWEIDTDREICAQAFVGIGLSMMIPPVALPWMFSLPYWVTRLALDFADPGSLSFLRSVILERENFRNVFQCWHAGYDLDLIYNRAGTINELCGLWR